MSAHRSAFGRIRSCFKVVVNGAVGAVAGEQGLFFGVLDESEVAHHVEHVDGGGSRVHAGGSRL
eukprot:8525266-Prorocentrum_lima.AAC.1